MTVALLIVLPPFVYYLWASLAFNHGRPMFPSAQFIDHFPWPTATSVGIVAGWLLFQALLQQYGRASWSRGRRSRMERGSSTG